MTQLALEEMFSGWDSSYEAMLADLAVENEALDLAARDDIHRDHLAIRIPHRPSLADEDLAVARR